MIESTSPTLKTRSSSGASISDGADHQAPKPHALFEDRWNRGLYARTFTPSANEQKLSSKKRPAVSSLAEILWVAQDSGKRAASAPLTTRNAITAYLKAQIAIPDAIELLRREDVISAYIYGTKGTLVTGISNVDRASVAARCSLEHLRTRKSAP